ncbi:MAG: hypothetical protein WBZ19_02245 [Chthoniobacterales bacterium]
MKLKLLLIGLAALVQLSCSDTETGNTGQTLQSAADDQNDVMPVQNDLSSRPIEAMR